MKSCALSRRRAWIASIAAVLWTGCSAHGVDSSSGGSDANESARSSQSAATNAGAGTATAGTGAPSGSASTQSSSTGDGSATSGSESTVSSAASASTATATSSSGSSEARDGAASSSGANCNLPATVSFQKDVLPFLTASCSGTGCHVIDSASTVVSGGYDHGYDWITAGAHPSSCPETPTPERFQVVLAVIAESDPPSCSKCGVMPPANSGKTPLTECQVATLQAWLDEPLVTQLHRVDGTSPTTPYAMPPFN